VITCSIGARRVWQDEAASHVVAAAGTTNFAAVALQNGFLQVCRSHRHKKDHRQVRCCAAVTVLSGGANAHA
jgi:hypothetical protein